MNKKTIEILQNEMDEIENEIEEIIKEIAKVISCSFNEAKKIYWNEVDQKGYYRTFEDFAYDYANEEIPLRYDLREFFDYKGYANYIRNQFIVINYKKQLIIFKDN